MVLDMAENELDILLIFSYEAACIVLLNALGCSSFPTQATVASTFGKAFRPHAQVYVLVWAEIVSMEFFFERLDIILVRIIAEMILAVQVLHEVSDSIDHTCWRDLVNIVFQRLANLFKRAVLVYVRERNKTMPVRGSITLELVGECHGRCYAGIATHAFVIVTEVIRTTWTIVAAEGDVCVAIGTLQAHAQPKGGRDNDAHNHDEVVHACKRVLCQPSLSLYPYTCWTMHAR